MKKSRKYVSALCAAVVALSAGAMNASASRFNPDKYPDDYFAYSLENAWSEFAYGVKMEMQDGEEVCDIVNLISEFCSYGRPLDEEMNGRYQQFIADKGYDVAFPKVRP